MKKIFVVVLALTLTFALAGVAMAGVSGSKHDLSSADRAGTGSKQVCVFCHHPHRGQPAGMTSNVSNALLWNIDDFSKSSFSGYAASGSLNATTAAVTKAAPQSFLCMACHDGTISVGALLQNPSDSGSDVTKAVNLTGGAALGTTFADDHPVNFTYTTTGVAGDSGIIANTGDSIVTGGRTYKLFSGKMQCGTCHDVHAGDNSQDGLIQFLRGNSDGSQICTDCHTNK